MKKIFLFLFTLWFINSSCHRQKNDLREIKLEPDTIISQFNDSTYFSDIRSMYYDKYLHISEYKRNQLIILDDRCHVVNALGTGGRGQGEFIGISHVFVKNDTIYVQNEGKRNIEIYDYKGYIKTISLNKDIQLEPTSRFFCLNKSLYLSSIKEDNSIVKYSFDTDLINYFGNLDRYATEKHTYYRNNRHILVLEDKYIIAVSHVSPVIEKYNLNGDLIEKFNYKDILPVLKRLKFIKNQEVEINSVYELISDVYIDSNKLYLILISNEKSKVNSNRLLEIEIGHKMKATNLFNLGEGWFNSMCVAKNQVWAFEIKSGNLIKYSLN